MNPCFEQCLALDFIAKVALIMWLWAVLWLDIAHSFGLFLLEMWIKITWTLQGCQELNVIRPSGTPPKAARSFDGK